MEYYMEPAPPPKIRRNLENEKVVTLVCWGNSSIKC